MLSSLHKIAQSIVIAAATAMSASSAATDITSIEDYALLSVLENLGVTRAVYSDDIDEAKALIFVSLQGQDRKSVV